jgi:hypothetical protein
MFLLCVFSFKNLALKSEAKYGVQEKEFRSEWDSSEDSA